MTHLFEMEWQVERITIFTIISLLLIKVTKLLKQPETLILCMEMSPLPAEWHRYGFPISRWVNSNSRTLSVLADLFSLMRSNYTRFIKDEPCHIPKELAQTMASSRVSPSSLVSSSSLNGLGPETRRMGATRIDRERHTTARLHLPPVYRLTIDY